MQVYGALCQFCGDSLATKFLEWSKTLVQLTNFFQFVSEQSLRVFVSISDTRIARRGSKYANWKREYFARKGS